MRWIWILTLIVILMGCRQPEYGGEMLLTAVPSSQVARPELLVTTVNLRWSQVWQCGVDVSVTIENRGTLPAYNFVLSLHDQRMTIPELGFGNQHTVVFNVTGEQMAGWMEASGTVDVDGIVTEFDETNNNYRHPLPYSAVPGMESIAICTATKNAPKPPIVSHPHDTWTPSVTPSHTITVSGINSMNTLTPSRTPTKRPYPGNETPIYGNLPNLRIISIRNEYIPYIPCIDKDKPIQQRHAFVIHVINNGQVPVGEFVVQFNGQDTIHQDIAPDEIRRIEHVFTATSTLNQVEIDPLNQIRESNEDDNTITFATMTHTPSPTCTKTPTMSPT